MLNKNDELEAMKPSLLLERGSRFGSGTFKKILKLRNELKLTLRWKDLLSGAISGRELIQVIPIVKKQGGWGKHENEAVEFYHWHATISFD